MSLFEDQNFRWRETYFVLFPRKHRPDHQKTDQLIYHLSQSYSLSEIRLDEQGRLESVSVLSTTDHAAMDICFLAGDDVQDQVTEFLVELAPTALSTDDQEKLELLRECDARFEVFHFERIQEGEEFLDPSTLFNILDQLATAVSGVAIDPQAATFVG